MKSGGDSTSRSPNGENIAVVGETRNNPVRIQHGSTGARCAADRRDSPGRLRRTDARSSRRVDQMVVTSPPYNIKNSTGNGLKDGPGRQMAYSRPPERILRARRLHAARQIRRVAKRVSCRDVARPAADGAIFYNHKWRVQNGLLQDRQDIVDGFPVRQIIIWQRAGGINFNPGYFLPNYEVIYLIAKPEFRLAPKANAYGSVWSIKQEHNNPAPGAISCDLAARCIRSVGAGPRPRPLHRQRHNSHSAEMAACRGSESKNPPTTSTWPQTASPSTANLCRCDSYGPQCHPKRSRVAPISYQRQSSGREYTHSPRPNAKQPRRYPRRTNPAIE